MRTFVAVEVDSPQAAASIAEFQAGLGAGRPVAPENLHFTLQFLGETTAEEAAGAAAALGGVGFSRFAVSLEGVGAFPGPGRPRTVWVGVAGGDRAPMADLAGRVRAALGPLGLGAGRPFRPHLTVSRMGGRAGGIAAVLEAGRGRRFGVQEVSRIKLKKSELTPDGPVYSDLAEVAAA